MPGDLGKKLFEAVIENENKLFKIFDRIIQLEAPRHAVLFYVRCQQRDATLLDRVDHILECTTIAPDQLITRDGKQVLDRAQSEVAKHIQRVLFYRKIGKRKLRKFIRSAQRAGFNLFRSLPRKQYCRLNVLSHRYTARNIRGMHLSEYFLLNAVALSDQAFESADIEQNTVLDRLDRMRELPGHADQGRVIAR